MTSSKQNVGDKKTDFRRRSQAQILYIVSISKIAWRWSFPTPSFCIVQNINRRCLPFQNLRFWKIATSEKISRATFKKISRLEIYELLFLWSPILPIEKICMTTFVLCFKIFCDSLFFFNCFFKFFLFLIFQSFNSVGKWIGQIFIFVIRDSFGFQDFSKILFHKFFFTGTRKKDF